MRSFYIFSTTVQVGLEVRPIYHQNDDACIGHLIAGFLALRLEVDLQSRLDAAGVTTPWPDLIRDLAQVHAVIVDLDGNRYRLRTDLAAAARPTASPASAPAQPPKRQKRSAKDCAAPYSALIINESQKPTVQDE